MMIIMTMTINIVLTMAITITEGKPLSRSMNTCDWSLANVIIMVIIHHRRQASLNTYASSLANINIPHTGKPHCRSTNTCDWSLANVEPILMRRHSWLSSSE